MEKTEIAASADANIQQGYEFKGTAFHTWLGGIVACSLEVGGAAAESSTKYNNSGGHHEHVSDSDQCALARRAIPEQAHARFYHLSTIPSMYLTIHPLLQQGHCAVYLTAVNLTIIITKPFSLGRGRGRGTGPSRRWAPTKLSFDLAGQLCRANSPCLPFPSRPHLATLNPSRSLSPLGNVAG